MSDDPEIRIVSRLFEAFTHRDLEAMLTLVSEDMEFTAPPTATRARGGEPYIGQSGMTAYFADIADVWRDLRVIPQHYRTHDGCVLATGRVYARDHAGSIIDSPAGWLFRIRDGRVVSGRVYERAAEAVSAFEALRDG